MANRDECMACANLIVTRRATNVLRADGKYENAASYSCYARKCPLPTITQYDLPGCAYFRKGEKRVEWYEGE